MSNIHSDLHSLTHHSGVRGGEKDRQLKQIDQVRRKSYYEEDIESYSSVNKQQQQSYQQQYKPRSIIQNLDDISQQQIRKSMDFTRAIDQFSFNDKQNSVDQRLKSKQFLSLLDMNQGNGQARSTLFKSPNWLMHESHEQNQILNNNEMPNLSSSNINISQNISSSHQQTLLKPNERIGSSRINLQHSQSIVQQGAEDNIRFTSPQQDIDYKNSPLDTQKLQNKISTFKLSFFTKSAKVSKFVQLMKQKTNRYLFQRLKQLQFKMIDDHSSVYSYYVSNNFIKEQNEKEKENNNPLKKYINCKNNNCILKQKFKHLLFDQFIFKINQLVTFLRLFSDSSKIIDPDHWLKIIWDLILLIQLIILIILIPLRIAFSSKTVQLLTQDNSYNAVLTVIFPYVFFFFEIIINFNTAIYKSGQIIKDRKHIVKKYFKFYLIYDLLIYLFYFIGLKQEKLAYFQFFILIRSKKILQLFKQMFTRLDQEQNYYFYTKIFRIVATILITCHIISCVFISLGLSDDEGINWIQHHFQRNKSELTNMSIYVTGLYWSVVTMITIGYGDVVPINTCSFFIQFFDILQFLVLINADFQNLFGNIILKQSFIKINLILINKIKTEEKTFVIFVAFLACGTYAYTFNYIGELVKEIQREQKLSKSKMQKLNRHMNERGVPKNVKQQVKKYYEYINRENQRNSSEGQEMISTLPQTLKDEVMAELYVKVIMQNKIFSLNFSSNFVRDVSLLVKEVKIGPEIILFNQDEYIDKIHFVLKGNLQMMRQVKQDTFINLKTLKKGDTLGQVEFFTEQKAEYHVKTLDVVTLAYITFNDFKQVISRYPEESEKYNNIKDKANLYLDYQGLDMQCLSCNQYSHTISECPSLKYQPNITKTIYQYNNSDKFQERQPEFKRKNRKQRFNPISNSHLIQNSVYIYQKKNGRRGRVTIILNSTVSPFQNNSSPYITTDNEEDSQAFQGNFGSVPDEKKRKSFFMSKNYVVTPKDNVNENVNDTSISQDIWDEMQQTTPINHNKNKKMPKARKSLYVQKQIVQQLQKEIDQQLMQELKQDQQKLEKQRFPQLNFQQNSTSMHNIMSNTSISPKIQNAPINQANLFIPNLPNIGNMNTSIIYNSNNNNNNSDTTSIFMQRRISAHSPLQNEFEDYFELDQQSAINNRIRQLSNVGQSNLIAPNIGNGVRPKNGSFTNAQPDLPRYSSPKNQSNLEFGSIQNIQINTNSNNTGLNNNYSNNNINGNSNHTINNNMNMNNNNNNNINNSVQTNTNTSNLHKSPILNHISNQYQRGESMAASVIQRLQPTSITYNDIGTISQYDNNHQYDDETFNTKTQVPTSNEKKRAQEQNIFSHLNINNNLSQAQGRTEFYVLPAFDQMKSYTYYFPHNNIQLILKEFKKKQILELKKKKSKYSKINQNTNKTKYTVKQA